MEEQYQSTSKEITQPTTSEEVTDDTHTEDKLSDVYNTRGNDPHWLIHELNSILEKGMFKHD